MEEMYPGQTNLEPPASAPRHRARAPSQGLEFSRRQLELAQARSADLETRELRAEERELARRLTRAQNALRKAEEAQANGELEASSRLQGARRHIEELERDASRRSQARPREARGERRLGRARPGVLRGSRSLGQDPPQDRGRARPAPRRPESMQAEPAGARWSSLAWMLSSRTRRTWGCSCPTT